MAQDDTPSWASDVEAPPSNAPTISPQPTPAPAVAAPVAEEVNDGPSWLSKPEENPRVVMDTDVMGTVWADATSDVPASGTGKATVEEKPYTGKRPKGGAAYCDKCMGSCLIGTVFTSVVVLEAVRSYVMYSAWLTNKCYTEASKPQKIEEGKEEEKEEGCKKCCRMTFICFTAFLTVIFYLIAVVAIILQFFMIEFLALSAGAICSMLACSCDYGEYMWDKVRGVGHRTRAAMARHCRPKKEGQDAENGEAADPDKAQGGTPDWAK